MTLEKAKEILHAEHGLELVDMYHERDLVKPAYWIAASERGGVVAEAPSWGKVFELVTGEAPI